MTPSEAGVMMAAISRRSMTLNVSDAALPGSATQ